MNQTTLEDYIFLRNIGKCRKGTNTYCHQNQLHGGHSGGKIKITAYNLRNSTGTRYILTGENNCN